MNSVQIENFSFIAGDHRAWPLSGVDADKNKLDFNNRRIVFTMKSDIDDEDENAIIKKVFDISEADPVYSFELVLTTPETKDLYGQYEYDLRISFFNNPTEIQYTALRGTMNIVKPVTKVMG